MIWFIYAPLQILAMIFCWLTNWFVVLFADKNGELPHVFRMWQTWDDSTNPRCYVKELGPKFLDYDWDKHYIEYRVSTAKLDPTGQVRWVTKCIDDNFTTKERIKRYLSRVFWLNRNCGYGFAFYCFGNTIDSRYVKERTFVEADGRQLTIGWDTSKSILTRPWWIKSDRKICKRLEWNTYLGWKWYKNDKTVKRGMIANRIAVRVIKGAQ